MSFYPQPGKYQCGPFALKYALVMLGVFKGENQIGIFAGSTWWAGTDEMGLARAARRFNCKMKYFHSNDPRIAKKYLNKELKKGIPCILSVVNWDHWITVVNYSKGLYVVVDSAADKVIGVKTTNQLMRYWRYRDEESKAVSYDGYALYPKFKVTSRAKLTVNIARPLMYKKNEQVATKWDQYFNDLITICKTRKKQMINFITFSEFLRRNERNLIKKVANWHGDPSFAELKRILSNMKIVAEVYDLIIPLEDEKKALIDISSILMMYSCGKYGMNKIY